MTERPTTTGVVSEVPWEDDDCLPIVMLDNGTDKHAAPEGAGAVTYVLAGVVLAVLAWGWWVFK